MEAIATPRKTTHIGSRRAAAMLSQRRIMSIMRLDEETYTWHKYKAGLDFLEAYTRGDKEAIDWIVRRKEFWGWWRNEWHNREEEFLLDAHHLDKLPIHIRRKAYRQANNPKTLAHELHPEATRIAHSYNVMLESIMKNHEQDAHPHEIR